MNMSRRIPYSFASSRYAGHPNDGGTWLRLGCVPPTPYKLVQSGNLGCFIAVQWQSWQGEPRFLNASCSALRGQRAEGSDADPRKRLHVRIHGIAIAGGGGGLQGIRNA